MSEDKPDPDPDGLEHVTQTSASAGRKMQLDKYEPINEQVTHTVEFPEDATVDEKQAILEAAEDHARAQAERALMRRYEEYVREEAFGE